MESAVEGTTVANRYELVRKLGAGGMGTVWLARDLSLDSSCAIKLVDRDKASSEEVKVRFALEAKSAAQLRGTHVVDVFDHGEWQGVPFIVMEFLEGEDLAARLEREGRLDPKTTYEIVAQVARALVRAHGLGIVHRDLKPENIFLVPGDDEREVAKVLDFGIAKHDAYSIAGKTTKTGSFMGTPFYVSPEQARGKAIDWRSDLWSLGVIIYQCLTGRPPFESEALGELMGMILYEPIPKLLDKDPTLPVALGEWWDRTMSRDREQRFQSAKELVDAFAEASGIDKVPVPSIIPRARMGSINDADASQSLPPVTLPSVPPASRELTLKNPQRERMNSAHRLSPDTGSPVSRTQIISQLLPFATRRSQLIAISASVVGLLLLVLIWSAMRSEPVSSRASAAPAPLPVPKSLPSAERIRKDEHDPTIIPFEALPKLPDDKPRAPRHPNQSEASDKGEPSGPKPAKKRARDAVPDYGI